MKNVVFYSLYFLIILMAGLYEVDVTEYFPTIWMLIEMKWF